MPGVKGRSGARQKTKAERLRDGSRKRPHHHEQPDPPSVDAGEPQRPEWLDDQREIEAWDRLVEQLRLQKRCTVDAGPWLLSAATAEADYLRWREEAATVTRIVETESGPKAHPAHQQARLARKSWIDILKEGGLTPNSIARVKMPEQKDQEQVDPFDALANRRAPNVATFQRRSS